MKYFYLISLCIYLSNCSGSLLFYQLDTLYAVTKETAILCVSVVLTNLQMTRLIKNARTKYSYLSSRSTLPFHFNVFFKLLDADVLPFLADYSAPLCWREVFLHGAHHFTILQRC